MTRLQIRKRGRCTVLSNLQHCTGRSLSNAANLFLGLGELRCSNLEITVAWIHQCPQVNARLCSELNNDNWCCWCCCDDRRLFNMSATRIVNLDVFHCKRQATKFCNAFHEAELNLTQESVIYAPPHTSSMENGYPSIISKLLQTSDVRHFEKLLMAGWKN